jgi:ACT domain
LTAEQGGGGVTSATYRCGRLFVVSYLLRLVLPDRPGVLGAVATALGSVGADILSVDVIERSPGSATDDFVVELPPDKLADSLVSAAGTVAGVHVESIRPYAGQIDPHRELALLDSLGRSLESPLPVLAQGVAKVFRAGWALVLGPPVLGRSHVLATGGAAPELVSLPVPWWPPRPTRPLDSAADWAPADWARLGTELAVTALGDAALLIGRPALRWLPSELVRLQHFAAIAASVTPVQADASG